MRADKAAQAKSKRYSVTRMPVVVDGKLADYCEQGAVNVSVLQSLGVGRP